MMRAVEGHGIEWVVDARGCEPSKLQSTTELEALFRRIVAELDLHPIAQPLWHQFPLTHGLTGVWLLTESHLACHSFPEHQSLCLNLFCCRPRPAWAWRERLAELLGASDVSVRVVERRYGSVP